MARQSSPFRRRGNRGQEQTAACGEAEFADVIRAVLAEADMARAQREHRTDAKDSDASRQRGARSANVTLRDLAAEEADHLLAREEEDLP